MNAHANVRPEKTLMERSYLEHECGEKAHFSKCYFTAVTDCF